MHSKQHSEGDNCSPPYPFRSGDTTLPGLTSLLRAYAYARDAGANTWDFALEIDKLYETGMTISDLRWLVARGFAEHGNEVSVCGDTHRSFDARAGFNFDTRTCLVLTADGARFAAGLVSASHENKPAGEFPPANGEGTGTAGEVRPQPSGRINLLPLALKPRWHAARRELYFGEMLVKRFRVPARNQEWILDVFEEDGWPDFIDDPLPPSPDICPRARLHDAINRLNHKQITRLLRFRGNGNGKGVYWGLVQPRPHGIVQPIL